MPSYIGREPIQQLTPSAQIIGSKNFIINGDFRINQREVASRTTNTNDYNYDRWYYDGTYLYQAVEDLSVANGTYVLSWVDSGSDIEAAYVVSDDLSIDIDENAGFTSITNGGQITVSEATEYSKHLWIRFNGTYSNLSRVQLTYGPVAAPFNPRSYAEELALCRRYYYRLTGRLPVGHIYVGGPRINFPLLLPTEMKSTPIAYFSSAGSTLLQAYGTEFASGTMPYTGDPSASLSKESIVITHYLSSTAGGGAGVAVWGSIQEGEFVEIDSEI